MKRHILIMFFLSLGVICSAQNSNIEHVLVDAPRIYTVEQHIDWIVDSYTNILHLTADQKQVVYQTILEAYKDVSNYTTNKTAKSNLELEGLQGALIYTHLSPKFKTLLTPVQYAAYKKIDPYPEACFSLSKDYGLYWSSTARTK